MAHPWLTLRRLAFALPLVYVLHVLEEAPEFVAWFNAHVEPDITERTFWSVTGGGLTITLVMAAIAVTGERVLAIVVTAWIGLLMLANGLFHLVATIVDGERAPGVITAVLLYLPFSLSWIAAVAREFKLSWPAVTGAALAGGIPMFVHGYRIVFEGGRLF